MLRFMNKKTEAVRLTLQIPNDSQISLTNLKDFHLSKIRFPIIYTQIHFVETRVGAKLSAGRAIPYV